MSTYCAAVASAAPNRAGQRESGDFPAIDRLGSIPDVKALLITEKPEGFVLERFNGEGEFVGGTQHETLDEAMRQAYSEYDFSAWSFCPDGVDPIEYLQARSDS